MTDEREAEARGMCMAADLLDRLEGDQIRAYASLLRLKAWPTCEVCHQPATKWSANDVYRIIDCKMTNTGLAFRCNVCDPRNKWFALGITEEKFVKHLRKSSPQE